MLARTLCFALQGVEGQPVWVETDVSGGAFNFSMVGLPDTAVRESRDRVTGALRNSGFAMPGGRITVNLSPADLRKEGAAFEFTLESGHAPEALPHAEEKDADPGKRQD